MRAGAAVGVDDDLASSQAAVALRAAHDEASGRVHEEFGALEPFSRHHGSDNVFNNGFNEFRLHLQTVAPLGRVLGGKYDGVGGNGEKGFGLGVSYMLADNTNLALNWYKLKPYDSDYSGFSDYYDMYNLELNYSF